MRRGRAGERGKIHIAERPGEVGKGGQKGGKISLYRALSMILVADPDQRVSEEMTGNLYNALHLVNIVNMDRCILLKGFQDYKQTPTPNILCMCTDTFMCVSAHMWIHIQRLEISVSIFLHSFLPHLFWSLTEPGAYQPE